MELEQKVESEAHFFPEWRWEVHDEGLPTYLNIDQEEWQAQESVEDVDQRSFQFVLVQFVPYDRGQEDIADGLGNYYEEDAPDLVAWIGENVLVANTGLVHVEVKTEWRWAEQMPLMQSCFPRGSPIVMTTMGLLQNLENRV